MIRVALTGGIASGKSYCLSRFVALGAATIDADVLARQAVATGTTGFDAVRARFGAAILTPEGGLDRDALARLIFSDPESRRALEAIVHPVVYAAIQRWMDSLRNNGQQVVAIADIPLLFETGRESDFDAVVVAVCRPEQQIERLALRSGLSRADAARRLDAQLPLAEKARRADYVIDTSGSFEETDAEVNRVWQELRTGGKRQRPAYS
jgi:dephospho-CoA kinase